MNEKEHDNPCGLCGGTGTVRCPDGLGCKHPCTHCGGTGYIAIGTGRYPETWRSRRTELLNSCCTD